MRNGDSLLRTRFVDLEQTARRLLDRVVGAHALECARRQGAQHAAIAPQPVQRVGEALGIVGAGGPEAEIDEQSAAGLLDDLGESAAPRLHHGHAARHRLEQEHPFRLVVGRRNGQDVQPAKKRELARAIDARRDT